MSRRIGIASLIWASTIFLSRAIGVVREAVFGRLVGGGLEADLYFAAFTLPDFLNYLLAAGSLAVVFIPIVSAHFARDDEAAAWRSFSAIATTVVLVLSVAMAALWLVLPQALHLVFPGFEGAAQQRLLELTRILLPAQFFHVVGALLSATLQARDRHTLPALAPLVYASCIVAGGLVGGAEAGASGFAWGVLVGSLLGPFGLNLVGCLRLGLRFRPRLDFHDPDVRTYLWRVLPIMVAFSVVVGDDWMLRREASKLPEGSLATLAYAKTILRVPMGVFGLAVGNAAFPTLSRLVAEGKPADAYALLSRAIKRMLVLALGTQVLLTTAGPQIARVIYGDRLPPEQHSAIGLALGIFCVSMWAWASYGLVARGYFALGKTWFPSMLGTGVFLTAIPLYLLLGARWGTVGLAAASTAAVGVYVLTLGLLLRRHYRTKADGYGVYALRVLPAVGAGIAAGFGLQRVVDVASLLPGALGPLLQGALVGSAALAVYGSVLFAVRLPEAREVTDLVARRLRRRAA